MRWMDHEMDGKWLRIKTSITHWTAGASTTSTQPWHAIQHITFHITHHKPPTTNHPPLTSLTPLRSCRCLGTRASTSTMTVRARGREKRLKTADSSTVKHMERICVPTLYMNSLDDPMTFPNVTPYQRLARPLIRNIHLNGIDTSTSCHASQGV